MASGLMGVDRECGIQSVKVKTKHKDKRVVRHCVLVLTQEFDDDIASALGDEAGAVLDGIRSGAIKKAELDISAVKTFAEFTAPVAGSPSKATIEIMVGTKAVCAPATKEDDPPSIAMTFEFSWDEKAWTFLGRRCAGVANVVLTKAQGEIDFGEGDPAPGSSSEGDEDVPPSASPAVPLSKAAARSAKRPKLRGITGGKKGRRR
jgi:hypothetical protein